MRMRGGMTAMASVATMIGGLALSTPALADQWKAVGFFGWFGVGKVMEVEKGHYYWTGEFSGTFQNDKGPGSAFHMSGVRCPAYNDMNFNTGKGNSGGYCVIKDANGDQATLVWTIPPGPVGKGPGTFTFISGTGKYEGIKGTYPFVGVTEVNWADGMATGYSTWNR
jgi:hypothetical protein